MSLSLDTFISSVTIFICMLPVCGKSRPTTGFAYAQMWLQFSRLEMFFHAKETAELLIRGLTACVSYQWALHPLGGRFVYVDIIQNGLQLVMDDGKLRKHPSDEATCDDSLYE